MTLPSLCSAEVVSAETIALVPLASTVLVSEALWLIVRRPEPVASSDDTGPKVTDTAGIRDIDTSLQSFTVGGELARNYLASPPFGAFLSLTLALMVLAVMNGIRTILDISAV